MSDSQKTETVQMGDSRPIQNAIAKILNQFKEDVEGGNCSIDHECPQSMSCLKCYTDEIIGVAIPSKVDMSFLLDGEGQWDFEDPQEVGEFADWFHQWMLNRPLPESPRGIDAPEGSKGQ